MYISCPLLVLQLAHLLACLDLRRHSRHRSNRINNRLGKLLATRAAEQTTFIVTATSNSSELPLSRVATPFAAAPTWGKVNRKGATKFVDWHGWYPPPDRS
jgi:hypothetical protein